MLKIFLLAIISLFSQPSFAHAGHDHAHWTSDLTHFILAVAAVSVVIAAYMFHRKLKNNRGN